MKGEIKSPKQQEEKRGLTSWCRLMRETFPSCSATGAQDRLDTAGPSAGRQGMIKVKELLLQSSHTVTCSHEF